jgi:hypothetical protein
MYSYIRATVAYTMLLRCGQVHHQQREQERRLNERVRAVEAAEYESRQKLLQEMDTLRAREQVSV